MMTEVVKKDNFMKNTMHILQTTTKQQLWLAMDVLHLEFGRKEVHSLFTVVTVDTKMPCGYKLGWDNTF